MGVAQQVKSALRPIYSAILPASIGRSRPVFDRVRRRYFARHPMKVKRDVQDPALAELLANGIVLLPKYFDGALIKTVHDKALAALEQVRGGGAPKEWNGMRFADDGVYRLLGIEQTVPETAAILNDPRLLTIAREYLGYPVRGTHAYLDYKPDFGKHDETTVPHMDSWMSQIKIFTLLNDIDPLSAPMVYWKRSHRDGEWRHEIDYQSFKPSYLGTAGVCPPHALRDRCGEKPGDLEKFTVTGPAGTVAIADVRGFHRASNVFGGYRLEVVQKITIETP